MKDQLWIFVALIAGAFGLVLIARQPTQNLPTSWAGPLAEAENARQTALETQDLLSTYENETDAQLELLRQQYAEQIWIGTGSPSYYGFTEAG